VSLEICLTRGRYPWDNAGDEITDSEILSLVAGDDSIEYVFGDDNRPGLRWAGHPSGEPKRFHLEDGNIVVRVADRPTIVKLVELSNALGARVLGDDGERYGRDGSWTHPAAASLANSLARGSQDRRSFFRNLVGLAHEGPRSARSVLADRAPFRKGDRVRDVNGDEAVVLGIEFVDGEALDIVVIRYADGRKARAPMGRHHLDHIERAPR
jgi:hypothetical protein